MAVDVKNICIGAAVVSVGAYVTAGGAGSLVDVGYTGAPTGVTPNFEDYSLIPEQAFGPVIKIPQSSTVKLKVTILEATADNMRIALKQPAANLSGTAPNKTLLVGAHVEQYHQIQVVAKGPKGATGVAATRTLTAWRGALESLEEIPYGKGGEQRVVATFDLLYDDTVVTADKVMKYVDTGGA